MTAIRWSLRGGEVWCRGERVASGELLEAERVQAETDRRRAEIGEALEAFAHNTVQYMLEERDLLAGRIDLPRFDTDFRDRPVLIVVRGVDHKRDIKALRPYIRDLRPVLVGVDGGADALLQEGFKPDMIVGDMDSAAEATLRCGAELVVHAYPDGRAPGREYLQQLGLEHKIVPAPGTSQDIAMLIAAEKGAELLVSVGSHFNLVEFLDKNRRGMASTFLTRLRVGEILVDAKGVSRLYRPRPGRRADRPARPHRDPRARRRDPADARPARRRRPAVAQAAGAARHRRLGVHVCGDELAEALEHARRSQMLTLPLPRRCSLVRRYLPVASCRVIGLLLGVAIGDKGLVSSAEQDVRASLRDDVREAQGAARRRARRAAGTPAVRGARPTRRSSAAGSPAGGSR